MAVLVKFTKSDEINKVPYKKGDVKNVSTSIFARLLKNGTVKKYTERKPKK